MSSDLDYELYYYLALADARQDIQNIRSLTELYDLKKKMKIHSKQNKKDRMATEYLLDVMETQIKRVKSLRQILETG